MHYGIYKNGCWETLDQNKKLDVFNPSTGIHIGSVPFASDTDMKEMIEGAHQAFEKWSQETAYTRSELLEKLYFLILENKEELAKTMTLENGKPYNESLGEIEYGADFIKWYSEEAKRVYGEIIPASSKNRKILTIKQAVGVVYAITPWNYPFAMITIKLAPALAAGCTFILKPSGETPLTAIKLFELIDQVGFPKGVCNLVTGDPVTLTKVVMDDPRVRKIAFTGSTAVGKVLMQQASFTMKKISLELGGHAPLLVFADADIEKAVIGTLASKFRNCGQVCIATNRVFVHESVKDKYLKRLVEEIKKLPVGDGFIDHIKLGPIINQAGYQKIENHVKDAVSKGANIILGGVGYHTGDHDNLGYFYQPTVLDNVSDEMIIYHEETFGPVVPVITFKDTDTAIQMANDTPYGLCAYFFTESISLGFEVAERLDYGIVGYNTGSAANVQSPFGGMKESGTGREGGHFGIEEYLEIKCIALGL